MIWSSTHPSTHLHSEIELAVLFLAVDNVEAIRNGRLHVGNLEVEPLMVMVRIHVGIQYQIVLVLANLYRLDIGRGRGAGPGRYEYRWTEELKPLANNNNNNNYLSEIAAFELSVEEQVVGKQHQQQQPF